eukprot:TRINITY_DN7485_c0_g1_i1.p2 TRINITY_DN7485_c0_g1~~TRINITY_DN7485_c0_g1_i1.p2  ORF type:complete len:136 (-),score=30.28 TRINITY_DN7485_c0_g1_i1:762-1169(-)
MGTVTKELKDDVLNGCDFDACGGGCIIDESGCVNVEKTIRNNQEKKSPRFLETLPNYTHNHYAIQDIHSKTGPWPMNAALLKLISQCTMPKLSAGSPSQFPSKGSNICEESTDYDQLTEEEMKSLQVNSQLIKVV